MSRAVRPDQHGTATGYQYGCKCEPCRAAGRAMSKRQRDRAAARSVISGARKLPNRPDADALTRAVDKVGTVGLGGVLRELAVSAA